MSYLRRAIELLAVCPLRERSYGGIGSGGGYGSATEFELGAQRIAEAVHCILGSLGKWRRDWGTTLYFEEAHIKEELGIVEKSMGEYSRPLYHERMNTPHYPGAEAYINRSIERIKSSSPILRSAAESNLAELEQQEDLPEEVYNVGVNGYRVLIALANAMETSVSGDSVTNAFEDEALKNTVGSLRESVDVLYPAAEEE